MKPFHLLGYIVAYESGELTEYQVLRLFAYLIKNRMCWSLQGRYGRTAYDLICAGVISNTGRINWKEVRRREETI